MKSGPAAAAVDVAGILGLDDGIEPVVLREGANFTVHLSPYPVVARVATVTAEVRAVEAYQLRELTILEHLARVSAPAVRPATLIPAGPHEVDGWRLILLHFHDHNPDRDLSGQQVGDSLKAVHQALDGLEVALPSYIEALDEIPRLLARAEGVLNQADCRFLCARAREVTEALRGHQGQVQALHGDVHLGNLLRTSSGPIWGDFEDACVGPVEWDLASLLASTQITTTSRELVETAIQTYGCGQTSVLWRACLEGNVLVFTAWAALAAVTSDRAAATLPRRIAWHRQYAAR